ncbi:hypothetical protein [Gimesia aquarii]|uniref:Glycosyltransferase RgtA/B/C/D-like domain-containing protein n=1 Tax=Gimesia aquarii TaxID=2527964 RepID=A0A517WX84_9PLAN|nr:hypothetical protein [Gimesia aquarii]QDU09848.1 hypothetical protein V202x_32450 [Gimesia aquarii]
MRMKVSWSVFILLILAALGVRIYGADARGLWFDESLSWKLQSFPVSLLIERAGEPTMPHPPLYFLTLHFWSHIFGDSEIAMRGLSIFAGIATLPVLFFFMQDLHLLTWQKQTEKTEQYKFAGFIAVSLVAFSILHIHAAQQVRGYTLAVFLLACSNIFFIRLLSLTKSTWSNCAFYAISATALCYTHNLGLFSVAAQWGFAILFLWLPALIKRLYHHFNFKRQNQNIGSLVDDGQSTQTCINSNEEKTVLNKIRLKFVTVAVLFVLLYGPWFLNVQKQSTKLKNSWSRPFSAQKFANEMFASIFQTSAQRPLKETIFPWFVAVSLIFLWIILATRFGWPGVYLSFMGAIPVILMCIYSIYSKRSIFDARYLIFAQLSWLAGIAWLTSRIPRRLERILIGFVVVSWFIQSCFLNWDMIGKNNKPGMRAAIHYILQNKKPNELIIAETPFIFFLAQYYARNQTPVFLANERKDRFLVNGESQLLNSDMITPEEVALKKPTGIWLISSDSYMTFSKNKFPADCVDSEIMILSTKDPLSFKQDLYWESPVELYHYISTK